MPELGLPEDRIDFGGLSKRLREAIESAPMPGLWDQPRDAQTKQRIDRLVQEESALRGSLAESGLWLLAGELDRSHTISQADGSAEGSYWHGIMHRREGDYWNSKYWFRKVGSHPILQHLTELTRAEAASLQGGGLPVAGLDAPAKFAPSLVDLCEQAEGNSQWVAILERVCWWEWQLLFMHCLQLQNRR